MFDPDGPAAPNLEVRAIAPNAYGVTVQSPNALSVDLTLPDGFWAPDAYVNFARAAVGQMGAAPPEGDTVGPVYERLLDSRPERLVAVSQSVSAALARDMRDARAHEAAALTLGVFGLREASGRFRDVRWALNRMTAHLALALALDGEPPASVDHRLASAVLLTLTNEQVRALEILDELDAATPSAPVRGWTRALRLRVTQDWRSVPDRAAPRLEKMEYIRARQFATAGTRTLADFERIDVAVDAADWTRLLQLGGGSVEEGHLIAASGLALELAEAASVFELLEGRREMTMEDLNARATRGVADGRVQVVSWGAWAELVQRHVAMLVGTQDRFVRHMLGVESAAEELKHEYDGQLGRLALFPLATAYRTTGRAGADADLRDINKAIAFASRSPERVSPQVWSWLARGANYEPVREGMPEATRWFFDTSPTVPFEAWSRTSYSGHHATADQLAALRARAPHDYTLAREWLEASYGDHAPIDEIRRAFNGLLEYDLRAIGYARQRTENDAERLALLDTACVIAAGACLNLANLLVTLDRPEDEAAAAYERAFADDSLDAVTRSNETRWLVNYYNRNGRIDDALALATESAAVGSLRGLITLAYLLERLDRIDEAEALLLKAADRYAQSDAPALLLAFYYRAVHLRGRTDFEWRWSRQLSAVFPRGLEPAATTLSAPPASGVVITKDSDLAREGGVQAGDIIIGLEGWQVENLQQYRAVNAFVESDVMRLTLWRGSLFEVTLTAPNRLMGIDFRTYPIKGWGE